MARKKVVGHDRAFLDDVSAHPDDDGPRLIYADWLEDQGQAHRAEFIRLQCRLASLDEHDPERIALEQREADILMIHGKDWIAGLPAWAKAEPLLFRRGFVDRISIRASAFLDSGRGLFAAAPVRELQLRSGGGKMARVAASPLLARVSAFEVGRNGLPADDLCLLFASPYLGGLKSLEIVDVDLQLVGVRALVEWEGLPRLRSLSWPRLHTSASEKLCQAPLSSLEKLNLESSAIRPDAAAALARNCQALTHLDLAYAQLPADGIRALSAPKALPALRSLKLSGYRVSSDALEALWDSALPGRLEALEVTGATTPHLPRLRLGGRLRRLTLNGTRLLDEGFAPLASAPLTGLVNLEVPNTGLGVESIQRLASSQALGGLRLLQLGANAVGDEGAKALAESPHLSRLERLELYSCGIGPDGMRALASSPNLARLRYLRLDNNPLGPDGVRTLAESPYLGELRELSLTFCSAGEEGVRALARSGRSNELRRLKIYSNGVEADHPVLGEFADPSRLPRLLILGTDYNTATSPEGLRRLGRAVAL